MSIACRNPCTLNNSTLVYASCVRVPVKIFKLSYLGGQVLRDLNLMCVALQKAPVDTRKLLSCSAIFCSNKCLPSVFVGILLLSTISQSISNGSPLILLLCTPTSPQGGCGSALSRGLITGFLGTPEGSRSAGIRYNLS